ncbi:TIGR01458 family HAD hydrolase [Kwoniella sp. DSM 27419]
MPNSLKLKALLIDLNGTLHLGHEPTRNAVQAIESLRHAKIPFIFCSNSTKESSTSLLGKLRQMGFKADRDELMTSLGACRQLVEERGLKRPFLLMSSSAKEEFTGIDATSESGSPEAYDSVILGLDEPSLSYENLNVAFRVLKGEPLSAGEGRAGDPTQAVLIAPHTSMFQQTPGTDALPAGLSLGIGPFVRALEVAADSQAEIVGKPTKRFFELALERLKKRTGQAYRPEDVAVIGDDIRNDLGAGAKELGLKRILVRTGKYRPDSETTGDAPDKTYDDFAQFVDDL